MNIGVHTVETELGPVRLTTDEELVTIEPCPLVRPKTPESAASVLLRMARVDRLADVGARGPLEASTVDVANAANTEVRRYEALFGRDALHASAFLSSICPRLDEATVLTLAGHQADRHLPTSQAEPGKVPNHVRDPGDPLARALTRERGRTWPWYGGTDTTVLFLAAATRVLLRDPHLADLEVPRPNGDGPWDPRAPRKLGTSVTEAIRWLRRALDAGPAPGLLWATLNDRDSFTVWTDSPNAFSHQEGTLVRPPVAPLGLQGLAHRVLRGLSCAAHDWPWLPDDVGAARLAETADRLRAQVRSRFVDLEREVVVASALDGRRARPVLSRTVDSLTSIGSGLWDDSDVAGARDDLISAAFSPAMLTPMGIAGRSRGDVRWAQFDYHSQVWGFATHLIARDLRDEGLVAEADDLDDRLLRQTSDGFQPENVGSADTDGPRYCEHVLTVRRPGPDGRPTITVKERPPAPFAAWTVAAVVEVEHNRRR